MKVLEFAEGLIRSPWIKKLQDRTFLNTLRTEILAIIAAVAIWQTPGVPVEHKVNVTIAALGAISFVVGAFTASEKGKDAKIATAAIQAEGNLQAAIAYDAPAGLASKTEGLLSVAQTANIVTNSLATLKESTEKASRSFDELKEVIDNDNAG